MAEALAQAGGGQGIGAQQVFKLEKQVVIVHEAFFAPVGVVGLAQAGQAFGMGQQMKGLAPQHFVQRQFLVARLAEQAHHGLGFGKGFVALAQLESVLAVLDRCRDVRGVHNRKGSVGQPRGFPTAQHAERKGVKSAALNAGKPLVQQQSRAVQHFLGGLAGKGEQQHGVGRDAVFGQPGQTVHNGAGFAAARAGHHQHGAVAAGGCLVLGLVERLSVVDHDATLAQGFSARQSVVRLAACGAAT